MRTVNQDTQAAWSQISYTKVRVYIPELELSIPDENIGAIRFKESISDDDCLFFVGCISSGIELTLNDFDTPINTYSLEVYAQKGTTTELKIFTGKIYTADLDGRNNTMKVVAYDALYEIFNANVTGWYNSLTFPMSMSNFRNAFFTYFGITQNAATLLFDTRNVNQSIGGETILGRDIIKPLCEANLAFGHIDYDGNFSYISITNNNRTVALGEVSDMVKSDYITESIDKVIVRMDAEDIGAVSGTGSNAYIIEGNMFFYGLSASDLQDVADDIFDELEGFSFQPLASEQMFNPIYELGDLITVPDGFDNTYQTIILNRNTDFQRETIDSKGLFEYSQAAAYTNTNLIALLGKTNRLHRDVEETRSTITNVAEGLQTEIVQTAEGLQIQIENLQSQIDGEIAYYEREGEPTLLNYPYWDFTTSIPCNNTIRTADIYTEGMAEGGDEFPHFTYTEQNRKDHRSDLVYDTDNNLAYRFVQENGVWFWKEIEDEVTTQTLARIATLEATAEELTSDYQEISLELGSNYYTKVQTESKISQSASQIQTTVSATYATKTTTNSLQSQITQQASQISAKVSQSGGSSSSFGWNLTSNEFKLMSNNQEVFKCNASGITVKGYANADTVNAINARVQSLEADHVTVNQLNAVAATVNTLNAKAITTDNFSAQNINANKITSGTISTSRIDINGLIANFAGKGIACYSLSASYGYLNNLYIFDGGTQYGVGRRTKTISGQRIDYWGW
jgi:hypothetical protein